MQKIECNLFKCSYVAPKVVAVAFAVEAGFAGSGPKQVCNNDNLFMLSDDQNSNASPFETFSTGNDATGWFE